MSLAKSSVEMGVNARIRSSPKDGTLVPKITKIYILNISPSIAPTIPPTKPPTQLKFSQDGTIIRHDKSVPAE